MIHSAKRFDTEPKSAAPFWVTGKSPSRTHGCGQRTARRKFRWTPTISFRTQRWRHKPYGNGCCMAYEGATENHTVVTALLQDLTTRGLTAADGLLVVIDGAKALAKAVRAVWGDHVLIPRCPIHKQRNVLDHLPKSAANRVRQRLRKAYQELDADRAAQALEALAKELERDHPGAAGSLRDGSPRP